MVGNAQKMGTQEGQVQNSGKYFEILFEKSYYGAEVTLKEIVRHNSEDSGFSFVALGRGRFKVSENVAEVLNKESWMRDKVKALRRTGAESVISFIKDNSGGSAVLFQIAMENKGKPGDFDTHFVGEYGHKHKKDTYVVSEQVLKMLQENSPVKFRIIGERKDNSALIHSGFG